MLTDDRLGELLAFVERMEKHCYSTEWLARWRALRLALRELAERRARG